MLTHVRTVAAAMALAALVVSCSGGSPNTGIMLQQQEAMSTVVSVSLVNPRSDADFKPIYDRIHQIDDLMSAQKSESDIWKVNAAAGVAPVKVSPETIVVLKRALKMAELTKGIFDPSIEPIVKLWDVAGDNPRVPKDEEIAAALKFVDYRKIQFDEAASTIFLPQKGMGLDFGGIAKGYAADEAERLAKEEGIKAAIFNLGDSSISLMGTKSPDKKWKVGIQNPLGMLDQSVNRGELIGSVDCSDSVFGTSGPYERFFMKDGTRYHHIMDPRTGRPAESGLEQVSVLMPSAVDLPDGLTTACFILGLKEGMKLVESLEGVAAVFVTSDKKIYLSSRMVGRFVPADATIPVIDYANDPTIAK